MSEKNRLSFDYKEISKALIFTLLIIIPIVTIGYINKASNGTIWPAVVITQLGFAIVWWVIRLGTFSSSSRGARRLGNSLRDRKINKLGSYNSAPKKKAKSILELQEENKLKSKQGIYIMLLICFIEFVATISTYV